MIIIREENLARANEIFIRYNTKPIYSILLYNGVRYVVFESGVAAALIEVDMKFGCKYEGGKIIDHDKI